MERVFLSNLPQNTTPCKKCVCEKNESLFKYPQLPSEPILKRAVKFLSHTRMAKKIYPRTKFIKLTLFLMFRTFSITLLKGYVRNERLSGN